MTYSISSIFFYGLDELFDCGCSRGGSFAITPPYGRLLLQIHITQVSANGYAVTLSINLAIKDFAKK
jgi:hypothetical protein